MVLDPKTPGVPRVLFRDCKGLVLLSVVEAGFIFSGSVGTGVILTQNDEGEWSAPSALGLTGVGFGVLAGAEVKDILILLVDDHAVNAMAGEHQIKFGSQLGITAGPIGREIGGDLNFSYDRGDLALSYSFSKGLFMGINLEGAVVGARPKVNKKFYGKEVKPSEILHDRVVDIPENSGIPQLHKKLDLLKQGKTSELTVEEIEHKEKSRSVAEEAAKNAREEHGDEIVYVDIKEEAEKEKEVTKSEPKEVSTTTTELKDKSVNVEETPKVDAEVQKVEKDVESLEHGGEIAHIDIKEEAKKEEATKSEVKRESDKVEETPKADEETQKVPPKPDESLKLPNEPKVPPKPDESLKLPNEPKVLPKL